MKFELNTSLSYSPNKALTFSRLNRNLRPLSRKSMLVLDEVTCRKAVIKRGGTTVIAVLLVLLHPEGVFLLHGCIIAVEIYRIIIYFKGEQP